MIQLKAYSKINLGLEILRKRKDGFHELNTVFMRTCLADTLTFSEDKDITVQTEPDLDIPMTENLVFKAAALLKNEFPDTPGAKILLKKSIPSGAGMGGGSSDAATALLGLSELWRIKPDHEKLYNICTELGSDVPYFLKEGTAHARSRGEILTYFNFEIPWWLLLIKPNISISTKWAYENLNMGSFQRTPSDLKESLLQSIKDPYILKNKITNDFEDVVFSRYPQLKQIKEKMYESGAIISLLSGSGSTVFGFFPSASSCKTVIRHCNKCFSHICRPKEIK